MHTAARTIQDRWRSDFSHRTTRAIAGRYAELGFTVDSHRSTPFQDLVHLRAAVREPLHELLTRVAHLARMPLPPHAERYVVSAYIVLLRPMHVLHRVGPLEQALLATVCPMLRELEAVVRALLQGLSPATATLMGRLQACVGEFRSWRVMDQENTKRLIERALMELYRVVEHDRLSPEDRGVANANIDRLRLRYVQLDGSIDRFDAMRHTGIPFPTDIAIHVNIVHLMYNHERVVHEMLLNPGFVMQLSDDMFDTDPARLRYLFHGVLWEQAVVDGLLAGRFSFVLRFVGDVITAMGILGGPAVSDKIQQTVRVADLQHLATRSELALADFMPAVHQLCITVVEMEGVPVASLMEADNLLSAFFEDVSARSLCEALQFVHRRLCVVRLHHINTRCAPCYTAGVWPAIADDASQNRALPAVRRAGGRRVRAQRAGAVHGQGTAAGVREEMGRSLQVQARLQGVHRQAPPRRGRQPRRRDPRNPLPRPSAHQGVPR